MTTKITAYQVDELLPLVQRMKAAYIQAGPVSAEIRKDRLLRAAALLRDHRQEWALAMKEDFGHRSAYSSMTADLATTINMLTYSAENVQQWMQDEQVHVPSAGMKGRIVSQALGVVGIISPWNFPINLAFGPLAGVFAAGNTAVIKPSELTPRTSELMARLVQQVFDPAELTVVTGDAQVGAAFSGLPFDHLVFTGSTAVAKHVMRAAAENLVPVTLELGGKSPVVVDADFDVSLAIERTLTVKTFNAGQICLAPDYLMVQAHRIDALVSTAKSFMQKAFPTVLGNPDYTTIINERHFKRLLGLLADARQRGARVISLAPQGEPDYDEATRTLAPHLVLDVNDDMAIMQEEIFGPLLPIMSIANTEAAVDYINAHPRPLAAYFFANTAQTQQFFTDHTTSGALVINDVMSHSSIETLPFGGVGASGMGAYHGIHGFRRFSHAKAVVLQSEDGASGLRLRAPYAEKLQLLETRLAAQ